MCLVFLNVFRLMSMSECVSSLSEYVSSLSEFVSSLSVYGSNLPKNVSSFFLNVKLDVYV